ncbi:hypothetical protein [Desertibaculum subflavum]|uniref:hypothetical protein n=1 Tax=Desertibaculum subflavum TaxID=2268458 RepID=UPI0013C51419
MAYASQLLALFLILLCFFIMLVALSQQRALTFGAGGARPEGFVPGPDSVTDGKAALAADLRQRLAPHTGEVLVVGLGDGPNLTVALPTARLFERGSARVSAAGAALIEALAAPIAEPVDGRVVELEAVFATPEDASRPLVPERAGALARELIRRGAPARRIAVGIETAAPDRVRLSFYLRRAEGAR